MGQGDTPQVLTDLVTPLSKYTMKTPLPRCLRPGQQFPEYRAIEGDPDATTARPDRCGAQAIWRDCSLRLSD